MSNLLTLVFRSRHLVATLLARGLSAVGVILVTVIVARAVSIDEAADIFLFMAASSGLAILARFGTDLHVLRHVASEGPGASLRAYLRTVLALLLITGACALLMWVTYAVFSDSTQGDYRYVLFVPVMAGLMNLSHTASAWLKGLNHPVAGSVFEASGSYVLLVPVLIATPALTPSLFFTQAVLVGAVMCLMAVSLAAWYTRRRPVVELPKQLSEHRQILLGKVFLECLPLAIIGFLSFISQWGMLFLAEHQNDPQLVSELNVLLRLLAPLIFVQLTLDSFLAPRFAAATTTNDLHRLRRNGILSIVAIALPVSLPFWIMPEKVINLIFGDAYIGLANHVPLAFLCLFLICCLGSNAIMLAVRESRLLLMGFSAVRAAVVLILTLWLMPVWGALGGVLAYLAGLGVQAMLARFYVDFTLRRMDALPP